MDSQVVAVTAEPDEPHTHRCGYWSCERRYRCLTQQQHTTHQVQVWLRDGTLQWVEVRFCSFECESDMFNYTQEDRDYMMLLHNAWQREQENFLTAQQRARDPAVDDGSHRRGC